MSERLPGMAKATRKNGRHRRALDALARALRESGRDPLVDALIDAGRAHADSLDRLEAQAKQGDASEHTITLAASQYRQALVELSAYLPTQAANPLDALTDVATTVRLQAAG